MLRVYNSECFLCCILYSLTSPLPFFHLYLSLPPSLSHLHLPTPSLPPSPTYLPTPSLPPSPTYLPTPSLPPSLSFPLLPSASKVLLLRNGHGTRRRNIQLSQWENSKEYRAFDYSQRFTGHSNAHTDIKEANFLGERGEYVAAGSDDGNIFVWEKATGNIVRVLHGDDSIVNCVQWHPTGPMLATSGIASTVNLWEPKPVDYEVSVDESYLVCKLCGRQPQSTSKLAL